MSLINLLKTSIASIKSHKLRVFLTSIGIIIGISSVVTILSIGNGLKVEVSKSFEETESNKYTLYYESENPMISYSEGYFYESDIYDLETIEGIDKVEVPQGLGSGLSFSISSISYFDRESFGFIDSLDGKDIEIMEGRTYNPGEEENKIIILSYADAEALFDNPKDAVGKGINIGSEVYEVIGVSPEVTGFAIMPASSYIPKKFMGN